MWFKEQTTHKPVSDLQFSPLSENCTVAVTSDRTSTLPMHTLCDVL